MKNTFLRLLTAILALLTLSSVLYSCANGDGSPDPGTPVTSVCGYSQDPFESVDLGGREFVIFIYDSRSRKSSTFDFLTAENEGSTPLDKAISDRNKLIEDKINVTLRVQRISPGFTYDALAAEILSGKAGFDAIVASASALAKLTKERALLDLNEVESLDKTYMSPGSENALRLRERLYFADFSFNTFNTGCGLYFNKETLKALALMSPYEFVDSNEWTLDTFAKLVKAAARDLDGDGTIGKTERAGLHYVEGIEEAALLYGAGIRMSTNDLVGYPEFTIAKDKEKTGNVYDKIKSVITDKRYTFDTIESARNGGICIDVSDPDLLYVDQMAKSGSLFYVGGSNVSYAFKDKGRFGFVPMPKYDRDQENYLSYYGSSDPLMALPACLSADGKEFAATVINALNYYSGDELRKDWYKTVLSDLGEGEEGFKYLDLVREGKTYDSALYFDLGACRSRIVVTQCENNNILTAYARQRKALEGDRTVLFRSVFDGE